MKDQGLFMVYTAAAIALALNALANLLGAFGMASIATPFIWALIATLAVVAIALIFALSQSRSLDSESVFGIFLFVGLCALIAYTWLAPSTLMAAGLSMGYALAFLMGDALISAFEPVITEVRTRIVPVDSGNTRAIMRNQQQESFERQLMQRQLERKVDEVKREVEENEEFAREDIKAMLSEKVDQARREARFDEEVAKQELKATFERKVEEVKRQEQATKESLSKELASVKQEVMKKQAKPAEPVFFVASKTGKNLHRKNCIVLGSIPKKNRITFDNEKIAVKQGYKLCRVCFPTGKV